MTHVLAWRGLRMLGQRGSNGRRTKAATAVKQPVMKFMQATEMAERWAMVPMGILILVCLYLPDVERVEMQDPYVELLREVNKEINY